MKWMEITVETLSGELAEELVTAVLLEAGVAGVEFKDTYATRLFLENNPSHWDYADEEIMSAAPGKALARFYLNESDNETLAAAKRDLQTLKQGEFAEIVGSLDISVEIVDDEEWNENWKKYYKPFRVGERLVVRPLWEPYEAASSETVVSLNPGPVFGTGLHQTTRMCMEALERHAPDSARALDLGCGSGILSIATILMTGGTATAVDIDKSAEAVVRENAAANGISIDQLQMYTGNVLTDEALFAKINGKYDIILANIVADVVILMTPLVKGMLAEGGVFITSGIIADRLNDVMKKIHECGLTAYEVIEQDEWRAVVAR